MKPRNTKAGYGAGHIVLHWLVAAAVIGLFAGSASTKRGCRAIAQRADPAYGSTRRIGLLAIRGE